MAEKTEKASPKKLRDAMKKGQVAKAQDLPSAFTFIASVWIVIGMSGYLYEILGGMIIATFNQIPLGNLHNAVSGLLMQSNEIIFAASIPILLIVSIVGVIANLGLFFAYHVFLPSGLGASISWISIIICLLAGLALFKFQKGVLTVLGGSALAGLLVYCAAVLLG